MQKNKFYTYLGTNGTLTTSIHLEGIYSVQTYELIADKYKVLTKDGGKTYTTYVREVPKDEVDLWKEIDIPGQN